MPIYFYSNIDKFGVFSNFSPHGVALNDAWWPTVEHFFQAQKFEDEAYRAKIRVARSPKEAKSLGQSRQMILRADWETVKDDVMRQGVKCKFATHAPIRELLLSTGDEELIENAPGDYYWGCGKNGTGQNKLGLILMEVRAELREEL
jgi:hypothetical protein